MTFEHESYFGGYNPETRLYLKPTLIYETSYNVIIKCALKLATANTNNSQYVLARQNENLKCLRINYTNTLIVDF
jgi:hypothetical protein